VVEVLVLRLKDLFSFRPVRLFAILIKMKNSICTLGLVLAVASSGCEPDHPTSTATTQKKETPAPAGGKKVEVGKNVYLEIQGEKRRVLVQASICLRRGMLEQLMTRKRTKEHEAILAADVDARDIHTALTLAKAEAGKPVQFQPKLQVPSGTTIKIFLQYKDKGKDVVVPAQEWIRNFKTKKILEYDWVFAGSVLIPDPLDKTKKPFYGANDGDVICVSNFDTALLDLPINSSKDNDDLQFEAYTDRIPPLETPVLVILEPVLKGKKK
jgi:hypothetical protein